MTNGMMMKNTKRRFLAVVFLLLFLGWTAPAFAADPPLADGLPPCPDQALAVGLRDSSRAYFTNAQDAMGNVYAGMNESYAKNPMKNVKGEIMNTYCIGMYLDYMKLIRKLLRGALSLDAAIDLLVDQVLNYVCDVINAAVENVLEKLCLPLPDLGFSISLPSPSRASCNGISMADLITVTPGIPLQTRFPVPDHMLSRPLSRWLGADGPNGRF